MPGRDYCHALETPRCAHLLQAAQQSAGADGDVHAAFQHLPEAVGLAADDAGMPLNRGTHKRVGSTDKPFSDAECRDLKRQIRGAQDFAMRNRLERQYQSLVRTKRHASRLGRLRDLLHQQYASPRSFWKLLRSSQTPLPVSLQPVQVWDAYLDKSADIGKVENYALSPAAYPQQLLEPASCLNVAISEEKVQAGLIGLHNGCAKGVQGLPSELFRYAKLEADPGGATSSACVGTYPDSGLKCSISGWCSPQPSQWWPSDPSLQEGRSSLH